MFLDNPDLFDDFMSNISEKALKRRKKFFFEKYDKNRKNKSIKTSNLSALPQALHTSKKSGSFSKVK